MADADSDVDRVWIEEPVRDREDGQPSVPDPSAYGNLIAGIKLLRQGIGAPGEGQGPGKAGEKLVGSGALEYAYLSLGVQRFYHKGRRQAVQVPGRGGAVNEEPGDRGNAVVGEHLFHHFFVGDGQGFLGRQGGGKAQAAAYAGGGVHRLVGAYGHDGVGAVGFGRLNAGVHVKGADLAVDVGQGGAGRAGGVVGQDDPVAFVSGALKGVKLAVGAAKYHDGFAAGDAGFCFFVQHGLSPFFRCQHRGQRAVEPQDVSVQLDKGREGVAALSVCSGPGFVKQGFGLPGATKDGRRQIKKAGCVSGYLPGKGAGHDAEAAYFYAAGKFQHGAKQQIPHAASQEADRAFGAFGRPGRQGICPGHCIDDVKSFQDSVVQGQEGPDVVLEVVVHGGDVAAAEAVADAAEDGVLLAVIAFQPYEGHMGQAGAVLYQPVSDVRGIAVVHQVYAEGTYGCKGKADVFNNGKQGQGGAKYGYDDTEYR